MNQMNLEQKSNSMEIMGIDLGTTNSAVAIYNAGTVPTLLPIGEHGKYTIPSCVRWDGKDPKNGTPLFTVGAEAYRERYKPNVCYSIKRAMGSGNRFVFVLGDESLALQPSMISAVILNEIKNKVAELYHPINKCIITVPAYFNQRQIADTLDAAKYAGLECVQILKEPTSASYIYSQLGYAKDGNVLIYDLGGGTFDVTHMKFLKADSIPKKVLTSLYNQYGIRLEDLKNADYNEQYFCRVLGTYGDVNLGGDDIDKATAESVMRNCHLNLSRAGKEMLYLKCEEFKKGAAYGTEINLEDQKVSITLEDLHFGVRTVFEKTMEIMSEIDMSEVSTLVLVGGSTKSKYLRELLGKAFPDIEISAVLDPDATVALGAGSVAKSVSSNQDMMYADVLPLPIGVLVDESEVEICIPKNTSMPYMMQKIFYTLHDNQTRVTAHVYQGVSKNPDKCTYLGKLTIEDVPPKPAGEVKVYVNFLLTAEGQLRIISSVDGKDKEETLVIDNIFAVNTGSENDDTESSKTEYFDEFEEAFFDGLRNNKEAVDLFARRREQFSDDLVRADLEEKIIELASHSLDD